MQVTLFDLDHTLLNINASVHFGRYLLRQKLLSFCSFFRCLALYCLHQWGALSSQKFHLFVFKALLSRLSNSELQKQIPLFMQKILPSHIRRSIWQRMQVAQQRGDYVAILSHSPSFLVEPIANFCKVNHWLATQYEVNEREEFAKVAFICQGEAKARYIQALGNQLNLPLSSFTFYSDSYLDLPALSLVGKAVAVAPDRSLAKISKKLGWEILKT